MSYIDVSNNKIFIVGEKQLSVDSQILELEGQVNSCKIWKDTLLVTVSNKVKVIKNLDKICVSEDVVDTKLPIQCIELINDDNWIIIVNNEGKGSKIVIYDLLEYDNCIL